MSSIVTRKEREEVCKPFVDPYNRGIEGYF
jgi:hypothetical protein